MARTIASPSPVDANAAPTEPKQICRAVQSGAEPAHDGCQSNSAVTYTVLPLPRPRVDKMRAEPQLRRCNAKSSQPNRFHLSRSSVSVPVCYRYEAPACDARPLCGILLPLLVTLRTSCNTSA